MAETRQTPLDFLEDLSLRLAEGKLDLPPCPQVALRIQHLLANEDVSPGELAQASLLDPILTGRIISVANSAMFSRSAPPTTDIRTAIGRIGFDMVKTLAFEVALDNAFELKSSSGLRDLNRAIRTHSRRVGVVAHLLAKRYAPAGHEYEAMLAGLLHEIGKLYILARADSFPDLFGDPLALAGLLGDWHAALGHAILDTWGLPESVVTAVGEQDGVGAAPSGHSMIPAVLRAAILISALCDMGPDAVAEPLASHPALRFLTLDEAAARALVKQSCSLAKTVGALIG